MEQIKAAGQRLNQVILLLKTDDISVLTACDELDRINRLIESIPCNNFEEALDLLKRVTDLAEDLLKFDGRTESELISSARTFLLRTDAKRLITEALKKLEPLCKALQGLDVKELNAVLDMVEEQKAKWTR